MAPVPVSPLKVGHIDDVQELRKAKSKIPERFVRDITERPTLATFSSSSSGIPIIDFCKLSKGDFDEVLSELVQLSTACEEWGFFQVENLIFVHVTCLKRNMVILIWKPFSLFFFFCFFGTNFRL